MVPAEIWNRDSSHPRIEFMIHADHACVTGSSLCSIVRTLESDPQWLKWSKVDKIQFWCVRWFPIKILFFSEILDATRNTMKKTVCQYFFFCSEKPLAVIIPLKNCFYLKNYVISKFIQYNHFNEHSYLRITKP